VPRIASLHRAWLPQALPPGEAGLLRLHLAASALTGILNGALNLADVTLAKTLGASPLQVTMLSVLSGLAYLGALFLGGAMQGRRKAPFILLCGVIGRLGLWLLAAWSDPRWFLVIVALSSLTQGLVVTAQVSIIKRAYGERTRSSLFGLSVSVTTLLQLVTSVALGWLMDWNEGAYAVYFGLAGVAGFAGAALLAEMEARLGVGDATAGTRECAGPPDEAPEAPSSPLVEAFRPLLFPSVAGTLRSIRCSVALVIRILRQDREFRCYERNFFLYGISILAIGPVVPLFLVHDLRLGYAQIGVAKGLLGQAGMIVLTPMLGPSLHRLGPVRFSALFFALLGLHPLLLALAAAPVAALRLPLVFLSFAGLGVAMAGVNLVWSLSGIFFARDEDPSAYQSAHTALTGVRGGIAPLLGYGVMQAGSKVLAFVLSGALFLTAAVLMERLARRGAKAR
jgi:MFS family permease